MQTRSTKLKAKRAARAGRPRKEGERYPSGDRKRSEVEKETRTVAIEARGRVYSLKTEDPRAGYVLGRLNMDGKISDEQLEAGNEFALLIGRYHAATGIPFPSARAQDIFKVAAGKEGELTEAIIDRARNAANRMMEVRGYLQRCVDGPQVMSTVFSVCVMDYDHLRDMPAAQMLWLKRGLNTLIYLDSLKKTGKSPIAVG